jgi:hypothetical protein
MIPVKGLPYSGEVDENGIVQKSEDGSQLLFPKV